MVEVMPHWHRERPRREGTGLLCSALRDQATRLSSIFCNELDFHNGKIIKLKLFVFGVFLIKKVTYDHRRQLGQWKRKLNSFLASPLRAAQLIV
jgi:hypothetical protein